MVEYSLPIIALIDISAETGCFNNPNRSGQTNRTGSENFIGFGQRFKRTVLFSYLPFLFFGLLDNNSARDALKTSGRQWWCEEIVFYDPEDIGAGNFRYLIFVIY